MESLISEVGKCQDMPGKPRLNSDQAAAILREVPPEKAFYFYRAVDSPLNVSAKSLKEFSERIKTVEPTSLVFHSERQDFENWTSMLGDNELSARLKEVRMSRPQGESLRSRLYSTTKNRVDQLARLGVSVRR